MAQDYTFRGWLGLGKDAVGKMEWKEFEPKPFEDSDIDINISYSGVCGVCLKLRQPTMRVP